MQLARAIAGIGYAFASCDLDFRLLSHEYILIVFNNTLKVASAVRASHASEYNLGENIALSNPEIT